MPSKRCAGLPSLRLSGRAHSALNLDAVLGSQLLRLPGRVHSNFQALCFAPTSEDLWTRAQCLLGAVLCCHLSGFVDVRCSGLLPLEALWTCAQCTLGAVLVGPQRTVKLP